jgi:O-antigen/teichoic acid export membrane protein
VSDAAPGNPVRTPTPASALRWNSFAVVGRQAFQFLTSVVLARILGPSSYGIISAATIYITLTTLVLDQGLASALIQRPTLSRWAPGAVATLNIAMGVVVAAATWFAAPWVAEFFSVDRLTPVLRLLGLGLVVKCLAIAPRAMQSRSLTFRPIAIADVAGSAVGCVLGVAAALAGAGPASVVFQVVGADAVIAVILLTSAHGPVPNMRLGELRVILPYGSRVMATNGIAYFSRNIDNILVGRVLGIVALSYYGMAYRVLVIPVQMIGQTVSRVMFPVFSRIADRRGLLADNLLRSMEMLATVTVPLMAFLAAASPEVIRVVLGAEWLPAASLLSVLAVAGARETVMYVSGPLIKATGHVRLLVRYELLATTVQVGGIVIGLQFGVLGVAVGYATAGFALTPVLLAIQRRLAGVTLSAQGMAVWPSIHAGAWAAAAYLLVTRIGLGSISTLAVGTVAFLVVDAGVLWLVHRDATTRALKQLRSLTSLKPGAAPSAGRAASSQA